MNNNSKLDLIVINKPKKILVATGIYPPDIGGPATYSKLLKEELPKATKGKVRAIILNFGEVRKWPKVIRHFVYFCKALYRGRYCDILYAQDPVSVGLPTMLAAKILRKPFLLKVVGDYAWEQGVGRFGVRDSLDTFVTRDQAYPWFVRQLKRVESYVAGRANHIVVPSHYLKKIVSAWGVDPSRIIVIYNAFDVPENIPAKEVLRAKARVEGQVVVSVGRLVPWKGFDMLIKIWPRVIVKKPEAKLLIVGEGPIRAKLQKKIEQYEVEDSVMLAGRMEHDELLRYLNLADLFVLNTTYEGFSHLLLEVASSRTPIITTPVGGNIEIINDGESGLLVEPDDEEAWLTAIEKILNSQELAETFASGAMKKLQFFSQERMLVDLIKLFLKC